MTRAPRPTDLQLAILRELWTRGEASVQDLWSALHRERGLAQSTVATVVARLEERGVLSRRRVGRTFLYRATVAEGEVERSAVAELVDVVFGGDRASALAQLLDPQQLDAADVARARRLLDAAEAELERRDGGSEPS
ncbi:MAG: BlaI/MecI/CopY family transcriptional regulator [Planctomycetota bacterium]